MFFFLALHFYHHISVPFFGYIYFRLNSICHILIPFCFLNTFCHVLVYGYYGISALGPQMQPYLWWKRYLTQIQIGQFVVLVFHSIYFISNQEGYSTFILTNYILQSSLYLALFMQFYFKTYPTKKESTVVISDSKLHDK